MLNMESPYRVRVLGRGSGMHAHPTGTKQGDWALKLIESGESRYIIGKNEFPLQPGVAFLCCGEGLLRHSSATPLMTSHVRFRGEWAERQCHKLYRAWQGPIKKTTVFNEILGYMRRTTSVWRTELPNEMGMHECTLAAVLTALEEEADGRRLAPVAMSAATLRDYLYDMRDRPTDLNAMAADLGVSRATLTRRSRQLLGESLQRAHEQIRLEYATDLLRDTTLNVREVALACGYDDQRYFAVRFKVWHGCSPTTWRNLPTEIIY